MTPQDLLAAAHGQFDRLLGAVPGDGWDTPTPCANWKVRDVAAHLVSGETMAVALLDGASTDEARSIIGSASTAGDLRGTFQAAAAASRAAFAAPGALELVVHHPVGDIPGSQLRDFRIADATLHAWDVARAIRGDETLDPELVDYVWHQLAPLASIIATIGLFGDGPSGTVGEGDDLQRRLLDLSGRRP